MEPSFSQSLYFLIDFSIKNVKRVLESIDLADAVILVFGLVWKHPFIFAKKVGMLNF